MCKSAPNLMRKSSLSWQELKDVIRSNGFEDAHVVMHEDWNGRFPHTHPLVMPAVPCRTFPSPIAMTYCSRLC